MRDQVGCTLRAAQMSRVLENTLSSFGELSRRSMFGALAYFLRGNVLAFVDKDGNLGLKITDQDIAAAAIEISGVSPFRPLDHATAMKNWFLIEHGALPAADLEELLEWAARSIAELPPKIPRQRRQRVK